MNNRNDFLNILYIEDDPLDEALMLELLKDVDDPYMKINVVSSLSDALIAVTDKSYDCALLDLTLPDSFGLVTLQNFHEKFDYLPVVVLSGDDRKEVAYQAVNKGAQDYLFKNNMSKEVLVLTIKYAIERKQAEADLQNSYERFRLIVEGTSDGIWDWRDINRDEQYWSPRLKSLLGYDDSVQGGYGLMLKLIHPDDRAAVKQEMNPESKDNAEFNIEFRVKTLHKGVRWFRAKGKLLTDEFNRPVRMLGSISDVNQYKEARQEQERLQAQLQQAHKLEAVGQLAAGVAHEINTPIQFVSDHLQFLSEAQQAMQVLLKCYQESLAALKVEERDAQLTERISSAESLADLDFLLNRSPGAFEAVSNGLQRVTTIIKAMQRFAQTETKDRVWFDANQAIQDLILVSRNVWQSIAEIKTDLSPDIPKVFASAGGLNQALLALIINASQAIAAKHKLQPSYQGQINLMTQYKDKILRITVQDNGVGISEKIGHRIFEPFFTTREVGQGLGQGLSEVHNIIVEQNKGRVWFDTEAMVGTSFYIALPVQPELSKS